jgi:hypothetical protein
MVLIGMRKAGDEWRFLLQNWWPHLQLVEVSQEYFISSKAKVEFVLIEQHIIPRQFERCNSKYAEADVPGHDSFESAFLER